MATVTATLNHVLELADALPGDEQEMLVDILRKRRAEAWRKEVAEYAHEAERAFRKGKLKAEPAEKLVARLRAQWSRSRNG